MSANTLRARLALAATLASVVLASGCVSSAGGHTLNEKEAAKANLQLGVAYLQQNNLPLAKEKLERAEKQDPSVADTHSALGILYERLDRKKDAERQYATSRRLAPDSGEVANSYAVFLCSNGKPDAGVKEFEAAARNPLYPTPWAALTNAAVCLRAAKRDAEAVPYLQQAIQQRPIFAPAVTELADLQLAAGKPADATTTVNNYLSIGLSSPEVLLVAVRVAQARGDVNTANSLARRLRRDFPKSDQARAVAQFVNEKG
jgi:type IV pilus assembly protein PilF